MRRGWVILPLVLILAGCNDTGPSRTAPAGTDSISQSVPPRIDSGEPHAPNGIEGTDCVSSGTAFIGAMGMFDEKLPEGWARDTDQVVTQLNHYLFRCERLGWGQLERGPVFLIWETHVGTFSAPEACRDEGTALAVLATQGLSDADAMAQAAQFGMPSFLGDFDLAMDESPAAKTWDWRWTPQGGEESSLTFRDAQPDVQGTLAGPYRFFWFNETAVSYADLRIDQELDQLGVLSPVVTGTMSAPMMYANAGTSQFVAAGAIHTKSSFSGTIHRFRDLACAEPIGP
jgi:hypothetical protein